MFSISISVLQKSNNLLTVDLVPLRQINADLKSAKEVHGGGGDNNKEEIIIIIIIIIIDLNSAKRRKMCLKVGNTI